MFEYTKLIPLLYPLNLVQNEWFLNLYQNLLVSIFLENTGRAFTIDELISCIYRNYNLKIGNVPELQEVLNILTKEKNILFAESEKYSLNPSKSFEMEENYIKILGIDDAEDNSIILEFEEELKDFIPANDHSHQIWNLFYNSLCLVLIQHFFNNLINSGARNDQELLLSYKSFMKNFDSNKDQIHTKILNFLKNNSNKFFKKHLIALIFFESVESDIKDYSKIDLLLEYPDNLDFFLERNILFFMEIMLSMYSIEDRIKSSTTAIATLLFEDSFQRNLYFSEITNKQNDLFKRNLRDESSGILNDFQKEWNQIKTDFYNLKNEFTTLGSKVEILKEGINKHSKLILEAKTGVDQTVKSKHEASINILKNKNVEVVNKITETSLFFFPIAVIILSAIFFFFNEYFLVATIPFIVFFLLNMFYRLLETIINNKLIQYHQAEVKEVTSIEQ